LDEGAGVRGEEVGTVVGEGVRNGVWSSWVRALWCGLLW
jgi:hypothetical protein